VFFFCFTTYFCSAEEACHCFFSSLFSTFYSS
jgi:hypothetical protein